MLASGCRRDTVEQGCALAALLASGRHGVGLAAARLEGWTSSTAAMKLRLAKLLHLAGAAGECQSLLFPLLSDYMVRPQSLHLGGGDRRTRRKCDQTAQETSTGFHLLLLSTRLGFLIWPGFLEKNQVTFPPSRAHAVLGRKRSLGPLRDECSTGREGACPAAQSVP